MKVASSCEMVSVLSVLAGLAPLKCDCMCVGLLALLKMFLRYIMLLGLKLRVGVLKPPGAFG